MYWSQYVTKLDRIRNERITGTVKVGEIFKKVQESRLNLKWYHALRREDEYVGKRMTVMEVPGKEGEEERKEVVDNIMNE